MKESKNIDRLFQEKFRDFEVIPPEKVWQNIDQKINAVPKTVQRPYWTWLSGIAVGLLLMFTLNNLFFNDENKIIPAIFNNDVTVEEQEVLPSVLDNKTDVIEQKITSNPIINQIKVKENVSSSIPLKQNKIRIKLSKTLDELVYDDTKEPYWVSTNELPVFFIQDDQFGYFQSKIPISKTTKFNRWSISTMAAPILLSSFHDIPEEETLDNQQNQKGKVSVSYGVQFAYQLSKRFSLQSGIHKVDFAYNEDQIAQMDDDQVLWRSASTNVSDDNNLNSFEKKPKNEDKITQVYGYVEIPIEAKYRLNNDGNFGVNLIGGFSTLFLNKNELYIETSSGILEEPGLENKFNSLNFSGNFGVELEYKVYKNVNFNLIPMFKVQTHTLSSENTLHTPYSLGLYSGLNLRF